MEQCQESHFRHFGPPQGPPQCEMIIHSTRKWTTPLDCTLDIIGPFNFMSMHLGERSCPREMLAVWSCHLPSIGQTQPGGTHDLLCPGGRPTDRWKPWKCLGTTPQMPQGISRAAEEHWPSPKGTRRATLPTSRDKIMLFTSHFRPFWPFPPPTGFLAQGYTQDVWEMIVSNYVTVSINNWLQEVSAAVSAAYRHHILIPR